MMHTLDDGTLATTTPPAAFLLAPQQKKKKQISAGQRGMNKLSNDATHTLVLLEVSTSDESCLRVCVRLREASANARVSSTGRVSHVSHPTHPVTPQPG